MGEGVQGGDSGVVVKDKPGLLGLNPFSVGSDMTPRVLVGTGLTHSIP